MKIFTVILVVAGLIAGLLLLSYDSRHKRDMEIARNAGHEFAWRYLNDEMTELQRQDFLLDIRAREYRLLNDYDREVADEFVNAFADSVGF